ncbi:MAG TPA: adenosylcobinamide-GDP ribazoletransferase [Candidatus Obscuribacterales bacterium]
MGVRSRVAAAIAFYTCLPVPPTWALEFQGVARLAPCIGLLIGGLLGLLDAGLQAIAMPVLTRSVLIAVTWIAVTGGLHLDGAMDTADGLAVLDPERRLEVMADSRSGAFGVMVAIALVLLKITTLHDLEGDRWLALMAAAGWGRWGQLVAIVRYPYLKPTGKGAFHKEAISSLWEAVPSLLLLLSLSGLQVALNPAQWPMALGMAVGGVAIAWLTGAWFNHKIGGHTGDTYGAVVEWTEAGLLCLLTVLQASGS